MANDLYWKTIWIEGSNGKVIACIPGLAQATRSTREEAIRALASQLGKMVVSTDLEGGKLLLKR